MKTTELKVARIGNSRGVRLPARTLQAYGFGSVIIMEERDEGILLRSANPATEKLSWEDTAREMAASNEDWSAFDCAAADGLEAAPWHSSKPKVAEQRALYHAGHKRSRRK